MMTEEYIFSFDVQTFQVSEEENIGAPILLCIHGILMLLHTSGCPSAIHLYLFKFCIYFQFYFPVNIVFL